MAADSLKDTRLKTIASILCAGALLASTCFAGGTGNGRTLYKWVDSQGVTHYGDQVPPEYAGQDQQVINSQGVVINRIEGQKTPEQLAAEDQKRFDAQQERR